MENFVNFDFMEREAAILLGAKILRMARTGKDFVNEDGEILTHNKVVAAMDVIQLLLDGNLEAIEY